MTDEPELLEHLAAKQWDRMTRSSTTYDDLTDHDKAACRAIVSPVLADIRDWDHCPYPRCICSRGHKGRHVVSDHPFEDS